MERCVVKTKDVEKLQSSLAALIEYASFLEDYLNKKDDSYLKTVLRINGIQCVYSPMRGKSRLVNYARSTMM